MRGVRAIRRVPPVRAWPYLAKWIVLGIVIGAIAGLGAIVLHECLRLATAVLLGRVAGYQPPSVAADGGAHPASGPLKPWRLPLLVASGALVAGVLVRWLAPEAEGHGTDAAIDAIHHHPKRIRGRVTVVKLVASAIRLAAGVGAIFRAPLGGALLGGELLYRSDIEPAMLLPSTIASIVAYLEFGWLLGFTPMLGRSAAYHPGLSHPLDLALFALLGVLAGAIGRAYAWSFYRSIAWFSSRRVPRLLCPAAGGLMVGLLGLLVPGALGTGYGSIQQELGRQALLGTSLWLVLAMPLMKIVTTSLSIGSGGSGGVFGPGMVIGAATGAAVWRVLEPLGLAPHSPAVLVVVGMAACLGTVAHVPIAVTVMAVEVTGSLDVLLPAMIAVFTAAFVVGDATLYRKQLATRADRAALSAPKT